MPPLRPSIPSRAVLLSGGYLTAGLPQNQPDLSDLDRNIDLSSVPYAAILTVASSAASFWLTLK